MWATSEGSEAYFVSRTFFHPAFQPLKMGFRTYVLLRLFFFTPLLGSAVRLHSCVGFFGGCGDSFQCVVFFIFLKTDSSSDRNNCLVCYGDTSLKHLRLGIKITINQSNKLLLPLRFLPDGVTWCYVV